MSPWCAVQIQKSGCYLNTQHREDVMADHSTISTELDPASPALSSHPSLTRRRLPGGAGLAAGAVLAPPLGMPAITAAAAQAVTAEPRPLDAAFRRRALEVRDACARGGRQEQSQPSQQNINAARRVRA